MKHFIPTTLSLLALCLVTIWSCQKSQEFDQSVLTETNPETAAVDRSACCTSSFVSWNPAPSNVCNFKYVGSGSSGVAYATRLKFEVFRGTCLIKSEYPSSVLFGGFYNCNAGEKNVSYTIYPGSCGGSYTVKMTVEEQPNGGGPWQVCSTVTSTARNITGTFCKCPDNE